MSRVPVMIDEEIIALLGAQDHQVERSIAESVVLELYRRHDISARRAARLLDMEFMAFLRWSGELGIPYIDMTQEEWQAELQAHAELDKIRARRR